MCFFNRLSALKELSYCFFILFITTVQLTYKRKFTFLFSSYTVLPVVNPIQRSALLENLGTTGPLARNSRILILHLTIKATCHEIFHLQYFSLLKWRLRSINLPPDFSVCYMSPNLNLSHCKCIVQSIIDLVPFTAYQLVVRVNARQEEIALSFTLGNQMFTKSV